MSLNSFLSITKAYYSFLNQDSWELAEDSRESDQKDISISSVSQGYSWESLLDSRELAR